MTTPDPTCAVCDGYGFLPDYDHQVSEQGPILLGETVRPCPSCNNDPTDDEYRCTCDGCWACDGNTPGCTCDVDWDSITEARLDGGRSR